MPHAAAKSNWKKQRTIEDAKALIQADNEAREKALCIPPIKPPSWPALPNKAVWHGPAGELVKIIEPHTEADILAILIQLLAAFGNLIGRTAHFIADGAKHFCNLFAVIVGQTSKARKGTSWYHVENTMRQVDPDWMLNCIKTGLSSGEGLIQAIADEDGSEDKRLLVIEPEFVGAMKRAQWKGNTQSAQLRQAWDSPEVMQTLTKNNPVRATNPHVSLIGHCTQEELTSEFTGIDAASGWANKILWFAARRSKLLPLGGALDESALQEVVAELKRAADFAEKRQIIDFNEQAKARWVNHVYSRLSIERPGVVGAITARAEAMVRRLATIYGLLDRSPQVTVEHLEAAEALWQYSDRSAQYIFGTQGSGNKDRDLLLATLRTIFPLGLNRTEMHKLFNNHKTSIEIAKLLGELERDRLVEMRPYVDAEGKSKERWYYVPEI